MKALLWTKYGGVEGLVYGDAPLPEPAKGEVRIRVHAAGLNAADLYLMQGKPFPVRFQTGLTRPRFTALGADVAGVVDAVGPGVTNLQPGNRVFGDLSGARWGALAQYVVGPAKVLAPLPPEVTFEQAAAVPMAGVTALKALVEVGGVQPGWPVLVHGASGGVGTFAVQIAKALGAQVTAVCSERNLDLVRALGAERVLDYRAEDFTTLEPTFQLVLAANGDRPLKDYGKVLVPGGVTVVSGGSMRQISQSLIQGPWLSLGRRRYRSVMGQPESLALVRLVQWMREGSLKPVIDRVFPLQEGAAAFTWLKSGQSRGKVVVTID